MNTRDVAELAQTLFEEIGDAAFIADPETLKVTDVNPMAQRLTGLARRELLQFSLDQLFRSDEDVGLSHLQRALQTTQTFHSQEGYFLRQGGWAHWLPVNLTLTRLHTEREPLGLVLARDITDRVRAEDELRLANSTLEERVRDRTSELAKSNEALRQEVAKHQRAEEALHLAQQRLVHLVDSSPAVLLQLALDSRRIRGISWISDNLQQMLGYMPVDAYRQDWWLGHVFAQDREMALTEIESQLFAHGHCASEFRFRHGDGNYRWTRLDVRLVRDTSGQQLEAIGSWSDITEHKRLEDLYRQSQKMEAIGKLASGVAHDFNNLLTVINGYGELLLGELPVGNPSRDLIQVMLAAGDRAAGLTRQLLAFSRKAIVELKVLDLAVVVTDVERMLRRIVGEDIQLAVSFEPDAGAIKADPGQIEQVILNLVVNARDAMPRGGKLTIEVRKAELDAHYCKAHPDAGPGLYVLLAVSDTGTGMDEATRARIFEPFFTTKGERGTGLGLATVHGIVRQSNGHVAVYSELGRGTTFKVYLPLVETRAPTVRTGPGKMTLPPGTETILLAEDEDGVRAFIKMVLQHCGYTVKEARDGYDAVEVAHNHSGRIDLLISDVVMPRLGGRDLAERIVQMFPGIKLLFLSGYTDDAVVRHGILEAEVAFLQKPFTPALLAAKVRQVLDGAI